MHTQAGGKLKSEERRNKKDVRWFMRHALLVEMKGAAVVGVTRERHRQRIIIWPENERDR